MRTKTLLLAVVAVAACAVTACNPTPSANVYLTGDSNWPATELSATTKLLRDRPLLTVMDTWPGLGLARDPEPYGDGFAARRLTATLDAAPVDVIVTNLGGNDGTEPLADVTTAATGFLDAADGLPVIWIAPSPVGPNAANLAAVGQALTGLQASYPNLWVIDLEALMAHVGGCPHLGADYRVTVGPAAGCYVNAATDVHLSNDGRLVLAATVRVALDAWDAGAWRDPLTGKADQFVAALAMDGV